MEIQYGRCFRISSMEHQINEDIRDKEVRLISDTGEQLGIVSSKEAMEIAVRKGRVLVKIAAQAQPPVCRIMDYGKYKYETVKKEKENKRNQKVVELKEVWLSATIDTGDLNTKAKQAIKFIESGNKVKVSIRLRGRQMARPEYAVEVMNDFFGILGGCAQIDKQPTAEGRIVTMMLSPAVKK